MYHGSSICRGSDTIGGGGGSALPPFTAPTARRFQLRLRMHSVLAGQYM
jgi:hypothetical protein